MAPRVIKLREQQKPSEEATPEPSSQRRRPEVGRYLLQVDRQTKGSYATIEAAQAAGLAIKKKHSVVQVSIYDSVDTRNTRVELPTE
jgi:hypothetical protein